MRLLLLARHGQSLFNVDGIVNGDPARDGASRRRAARRQAPWPSSSRRSQIDLCVVSRFPRAQETARIALGEAERRRCPRVVDGDLDDIRIGELEGRTLADYRAWKHGRTP